MPSTHVAIESITAGMVKPTQFTLWVDDAAVYRNLPEPLRRLREEAHHHADVELWTAHEVLPLRVYLTGQHPPLVTADDDIIYQPTWLRDLFDAYRRTRH